MPSWKRALENFDRRLDHEDIDEFLEHLNTSINHRIKRLNEENRNLSPEQFEDPEDIDAYRMHLSDLASSAYEAKELGDELSIIALYKKVETHTGRVVRNQLGVTSNLAYFKQLCAALPFDIKNVDGFAGFNELRLINNSIKHSGKVSTELAKEFPSWKQGEKLTKLDEAFQRLLPEVKKYVADLTGRVYAAVP